MKRFDALAPRRCCEEERERESDFKAMLKSKSNKLSISGLTRVFGAFEGVKSRFELKIKEKGL